MLLIEDGGGDNDDDDDDNYKITLLVRTITLLVWLASYLIQRCLSFLSLTYEDCHKTDDGDEQFSSWFVNNFGIGHPTMTTNLGKHKSSSSNDASSSLHIMRKEVHSETWMFLSSPAISYAPRTDSDWPTVKMS